MGNQKPKWGKKKKKKKKKRKEKKRKEKKRKKKKRKKRSKKKGKRKEIEIIGHGEYMWLKFFIWFVSAGCGSYADLNTVENPSKIL
jgi:transposase